MAEVCHQKALSIQEKALGKEHHLVGESWNNLGTLYYAQGNYAQAEECHKKALSIVTQSLGKDHPHTQRAQENLNFVRRKSVMLYLRPVLLVGAVMFAMAAFFGGGGGKASTP